MTLLIDFDAILYRATWAAAKGDYLMNVEYTDNIIESLFDRFETRDYRGFLTGRNNFRTILYPEYKANRKDLAKPPYIKEVREYLEAEWRGEVADGMEADDAIGLLHDEDTVICARDKDFKTISGWYYDIGDGTLEYIEEEQAIQNFLVQMLIGDKVDNIPGLPNPAKAHHKTPPNFTENTAKELLTGSIAENLAKVTELYNDNKKFDLIANLLWIRRKNAETYKDCNLLYPSNV